MRAPHTGTIDRRGDRWRIRISMPDGTRPAWYTEPGEPREDAERLLAALLLEFAGTANDPRIGTRTLGAWGVTWLQERAKTHRDADGDEQRWGAYVAGTSIATKKLDAITPSDVRKWAKRWLTTKSERTGRLRDRGTVANALTTLRAAIRAAIEAEVIATDVGAALLAVELPRGTIEQHVETEEAIDALTLAEIRAVLALELTPEQRSAFVVGVYLGPRAGELQGLDWSRIDWDRHELVVARSRRAAPKSGKVARIPLLRPAYDALRERWLELGEPAAGYVWPSTRLGPGGTRRVVGCLARGYDWGWATIRETRKVTSYIRESAAAGRCRIAGEVDASGVAMIEWPGLRERAGIARPITWHAATRHTCACHLLSGTWAPAIVERAWRLEEVSRMLRHGSVATTEKYYARFLPGSLPSRPAVLVPSSGPAGPGPLGSSSRSPESNWGPTVYEAGTRPAGSQGKPTIGTSADLARSVLEAAAAGDATRAVALAVSLAGAVIRLEAGEEASDTATSALPC